MSLTSSDWYRDQDLLVRELRRSGGEAVEIPRIAGFDDVREIRRGGQGIVYSATQRSTKRRVAVKVLLEGAFASKSGRQRFEREIDMVAHLRHPNIVNVHDSGVTADDRLYFVMEYIDGLPLDQRVLSETGGRGEIESVLKLFTKICDAVNHAHLQGVIHRDLKPGNILIDADGEPKVCDFGLAKFGLDHPSSSGEATAVSVTGQFMGSLPWASPEQLEGHRVAVDTRSDVYSLGVILYQLLTGRFPYDVSGGVRQTFENILHRIPAHPSSLRSGLNDEIDTIVLRSLAKDPARRYQSAGELGRDIRHYLAGEPIEAKRDSTWYSIRKTLQRHRLAAGASAIVMVVITLALVVSLWSWRQTTKALEEARQESSERAAIGDFLERMLTSANPGQGARDTRVLDVLNRAAAEIPVALKDQPLVEVQSRHTIGSSYAALGMYEAAEKQLQAAQERATAILGPTHRKTLEVVADLPWIIGMLDRLDEAETKGRSTLEAVRRTCGENDSLTIRMTESLADILSSRGKQAEAETLFREALDRQIRAQGRDHRDTLSTMASLAVLLKRIGRYDESEKLFRESLAGQLKQGGPMDPAVLMTMSNLAALLQNEGKLDESEAMQRDALERRKKVLGEEHPDTLTTMSNLATILIERRRLEEAGDVLRGVLSLSKRLFGADSAAAQTAENNLAKVLEDSGKLVEAEAMYGRVLEVRRRQLGPDHPYTLTTASNLAGVLDRLGKTEPALQMFREVLAARRRSLGEQHLDTMISENNLGAALQRQGQLEEAVGLLADACRSASAHLPSNHYATAIFRGNYGRCLMALSRWGEAEEQLTLSCEGLSAAFGVKDPRTAKNIQSLIEALEKGGKPEAAQSWRGKLTTTQPAAKQGS